MHGAYSVLAVTRHMRLRRLGQFGQVGTAAAQQRTAGRSLRTDARAA